MALTAMYCLDLGRFTMCNSVYGTGSYLRLVVDETHTDFCLMALRFTVLGNLILEIWCQALDALDCSIRTHNYQIMSVARITSEQTPYLYPILLNN